MTLTIQKLSGFPPFLFADALDHVTSYSYDEVDRVAVMTDAPKKLNDFSSFLLSTMASAVRFSMSMMKTGTVHSPSVSMRTTKRYSPKDSLKPTSSMVKLPSP